MDSFVVQVQDEHELQQKVIAFADKELSQRLIEQETLLLAKTIAKRTELQQKKSNSLKLINQINQLEQEELEIRQRIISNSAHTPDNVREHLIKTGQITPFESTLQTPIVQDTVPFHQLPEATDYMDDGNEQYYQDRIAKWLLNRLQVSLSEPFCPLNTPINFSTDNNGIYNNGYIVPSEIHPHLYPYQKTTIKWLSQLHIQQVGGILGDEMGLGKTIQMIAFLACLGYSKKLTGPILVVCPATVLRQWVKEFHRWWPPFRVAILHSSGSGIDSTKAMLQSDILSSEDEYIRKKPKVIPNAIKRLLNFMDSPGNVIVTTYSAVRLYNSAITAVKWGYCVLDEGHKIRNPDAEVTMACKRIRTVNRIILSGTPIQNNLTELWSLYDFVFPGKLGTLPVFQMQFSIPINLGGYVNATNVQVQTAYKCACILRDLISPYLLRRIKADVAKELPRKTEQVLFCKLTDGQRREYESVINSENVRAVIDGRRNVLAAIDLLSKICNHPDLVQQDTNLEDYGELEKSGKLVVVGELLKMWKAQQHKVLLFSQTRIMLNIIEKFVNRAGYDYLRMDGTTPIQKRAMLVDSFNNDPDIFVFLLTTKVGGLGVNLTGANRIIIYDPSWNPSTDAQARERAWRLGQKRDVIIYRLMTSGTIEEKIYHRQIFKQFLTNKILVDPRQQRFFKHNDLHDLFMFGNDNSDFTETGALFDNLKAETVANGSKRPTKKRKKKHQEELQELKSVANYDEYKDEDVEHDEDERILQSLFTNTGVHSALKHDKIVEVSRPEDLIVEKEAERVANDAIAALKESRRTIRKTAFVPTWTGKNGQVSAPKISSSSILSNLRQRNLDETKRVTPNAEQGLLVEKMLESLLLRGGTSSSGDIFNDIGVKVTERNVQLYRSLMNGIANYDKELKKWVVKNEFAG